MYQIYHRPVLEYIRDNPRRDSVSIVSAVCRALDVTIREPLMAKEELRKAGYLDIDSWLEGWNGNEWITLSPAGVEYLNKLIKEG